MGALHRVQMVQHHRQLTPFGSTVSLFSFPPFFPFTPTTSVSIIPRRSVWSLVYWSIWSPSTLRLATITVCVCICEETSGCTKGKLHHKHPQATGSRHRWSLCRACIFMGLVNFVHMCVCVSSKGSLFAEAFVPICFSFPEG